MNCVGDHENYNSYSSMLLKIQGFKDHEKHLRTLKDERNGLKILS